MHPLSATCETHAAASRTCRQLTLLNLRSASAQIWNLVSCEAYWDCHRMMQRALSFANSVRALQRARLLPPEVCRRLMQCRGVCGPGFDSPPGAAAAGGRRGSPAASEVREVEASALEEAPPTPALPLCERVAQHAVPLSELLAWAESAAQRVAAVGDSWAEHDEGPCAEDLQVSSRSSRACAAVSTWYRCS